MLFSFHWGYSEIILKIDNEKAKKVISHAVDIKFCRMLCKSQNQASLSSVGQNHKNLEKKKKERNEERITKYCND